MSDFWREARCDEDDEAVLDGGPDDGIGVVRILFDEAAERMAKTRHDPADHIPPGLSIIEGDDPVPPCAHYGCSGFTPEDLRWASHLLRAAVGEGDT